MVCTGDPTPRRVGVEYGLPNCVVLRQGALTDGRRIYHRAGTGIEPLIDWQCGAAVSIIT
jgi:hypothetical protein